MEASLVLRRVVRGAELGTRFVSVSAKAFDLVTELAAEGVALSKTCVEQISDPELRRIVEVMLFSSASGALLGMAVGGLAGGACIQVGVLLGAGVGFSAALAALALAGRNAGQADGGWRTTVATFDPAMEGGAEESP
jgi:hypothetical protein